MRTATFLDTVTVAPTLEDTRGRAWLVPPFDDGAASIALWMIECQWAHPLWHSYLLSLVHLRPLDDERHPVKFYLDGATHEIVLYALNPEKPRDDVFKGDPHLLNPANFSAQFIAQDDEQAAAKVRQNVREIIAGILSPDTDFRSEWIRRYNDRMVLR